MRLFHAALLALLLASPAGAVSSIGEPGAADNESVQVYNEQNEKLGEASLVLMDDAGEPQGIVVKMSEIDATRIEVLVPVDRIRDATGDRRIVIAATRDELRAMPRLELEQRSSEPRANTAK